MCYSLKLVTRVGSFGDPANKFRSLYCSGICMAIIEIGRRWHGRLDANCWSIPLTVTTLERVRVSAKASNDPGVVHPIPRENRSLLASAHQ